VRPDQYNQVNAIQFLVLATTMVAEMEYDGWARILAAPRLTYIGSTQPVI
jgi:hypothetical protein